MTIDGKKKKFDKIHPTHDKKHSANEELKQPSHEGLPGGSEVKNPPPNAGDMGSILRSGRSPGGGNGNPLRNFCLQNPTDRGAWWATVHGFAESWTRLIIARHSLLHMIEIIYRKTTVHNISNDKKKNSYSPKVQE